MELNELINFINSNNLSIQAIQAAAQKVAIERLQDIIPESSPGRHYYIFDKDDEEPLYVNVYSPNVTEEYANVKVEFVYAHSPEFIEIGVLYNRDSYHDILPCSSVLPEEITLITQKISDDIAARAEQGKALLQMLEPDRSVLYQWVGRQHSIDI